MRRMCMYAFEQQFRDCHPKRESSLDETKKRDHTSQQLKEREANHLVIWFAKTCAPPTQQNSCNKPCGACRHTLEEQYYRCSSRENPVSERGPDTTMDGTRSEPSRQNITPCRSHKKRQTRLQDTVKRKNQEIWLTEGRIIAKERSGEWQLRDWKILKRTNERTKFGKRRD